jgi:alkaline phosphatase D
MVDRRKFLSGAAAAAMLLSPHVAVRAQVQRPRFTRYPFSLGVASGFPTAESIVLWTRLAPEPLAPSGGMDPVAVPVTWELALDEKFSRGFRSGIAYAEPSFGHSIHVEPPGLESGREYFYRFRVGEISSPVGRSWTAPAAGQSRAKLSLAVACCQQYEQGHYTAYRHMADSSLDLVIHLGDYIYETGGSGARVRHHEDGECYSLEDYRRRHSLYRTDPALQAAHAACPWLLVTDDHEVDNDYAGAISEEGDPPAAFLMRRAAAYRAYYENLPLPRRALPMGPDMQLYTTRAVGDLATFFLLDERQYRSPHACPPPGSSASARVYVDECAELAQPARTMLGAAQEAWLEARLAASRSRWNVLAQGVVMAWSDEGSSGRERHWTDSWSGYPAARDRFMQALQRHAVANPVVLGGDIHAFVASELRLKAGDFNSPLVASELVTTSISSKGPPQAVVDALRANTADVRYADGDVRGYLRLSLDARQLRADMVAMDTVLASTSAARVLKSYVIEDGRRGLSAA